MDNAAGVALASFTASKYISGAFVDYLCMCIVVVRKCFTLYYTIQTKYYFKNVREKTFDGQWTEFNCFHKVFSVTKYQIADKIFSSFFTYLFSE